MGLSWDIDTAASFHVIQSAAINVDAHTVAANVVDTALQEVVAALKGGLVSGAVAEYVQTSLVPGMTAVQERSHKVITGTHQALQAYQRGDGEMAANAQFAALQNPQTSVPGYVPRADFLR